MEGSTLLVLIKGETEGKKDGWLAPREKEEDSIDPLEEKVRVGREARASAIFFPFPSSPSPHPLFFLPLAP